MNPMPIDEPTSQFLEAASIDLQRQLGVGGDVEKIWIGDSAEGVELRARIRVGAQVIHVYGQGDSIVEAYTELYHQVAVPTLVTAFRQLVER